MSDELQGVRVEVDCRSAMQGGTDELTVVFSNFKPRVALPEYATRKIGGAFVTVNGFRMVASQVGSVFTLKLPRGWSDQGGALDVTIDVLDVQSQLILSSSWLGVQEQ
ncbi:MAG: hypothetical protein KDC38_02870 [Planctomycetes bacterium]|nr:hypothetical protein [Planctomycetota bacterium]